MKKISPETSRRVCAHMNKDHKESIYTYLKHYAKISNFTKATMIDINNKSIIIKYDDKEASINFKKEISEEEIHDTLVDMIKSIKQN